MDAGVEKRDHFVVWKFVLALFGAGMVEFLRRFTFLEIS